MEDSDFLCPLCCEELDISDRNFYPCKCGYQVCMWCWHRIRESESGLCPACRTPYGDDPHEFSAVDVQEVLRANKEKAAAEKKNVGVNSLLKENLPAGASGEQDRTALANMRVIRRNLVYAVGLPPLSEELLRKPEYFGQYGKISKIVLNRNNPPAGDVRRASASAYVTFQHKEDTLACILALDGFYLDGRNIRASYGTSKYCSAFIKNVRCNNPECTYLHSMGEKDDTFTKQEIQAGYVTSGRDVLERQQQTGARRKVGGGGPSGSGKATSNPAFPPPTYEEPPKPPSLVPSIGMVRSSSTTSKSVRAAVLTGTSPPNSGGLAMRKLSSAASATTTTAASVVAGMHAPEPSTTPTQSSRTTTLTPLTPLKPRSSVSSSKPKLLQERNKSAGAGMAGPAAVVAKSEDTIGGSVIGGTSLFGGVGTGVGSVVASSGGAPGGSLIGGFTPSSLDSGSTLLGGHIIGGGGTTNRLTGLGGEIYTGELSTAGHKPSAIGSDKWVGSSTMNSNTTSSLLGDTHSFNGTSAGVIGGGAKKNGGGGGFGAIGSSSAGNGGSAFGNGATNNAGTSTLASMLGISLPTGSGSLANEGNPLWQQQQHQQPEVGAIGSRSTLGGGGVTIGAIGGGAIGGSRGGVIGSSATVPTSNKIGGMAIGGGGSRDYTPTRSNTVGSSNNQSDIALLQSLLPGVHITSGQPQQSNPAADNWNSHQQQNGKNWTGFHAAPGGVIGAPKPQQQHLQHHAQQAHQQQAEKRNNIW